MQNKTTHTVKVWTVVTKDMQEQGYTTPIVSFALPDEQSIAGAKCTEYTAELPTRYQYGYFDKIGYGWLWNKDQDAYPVLATIDHDATTLSLCTLDNNGWSDGGNIECYKLTPLY